MRRINKRNMQCFVCKKFDKFARECNSNRKQPHVDETKVEWQVFDKEKTLLGMITEGECSNSRLQDNSSS